MAELNANATTTKAQLCIFNSHVQIRIIYLSGFAQKIYCFKENINGS